MGGSRTVKTLMALLVAMTLGSLALRVLDTDPVRPTAQPLTVLTPSPSSAARILRQTRVPLQAIQWRYVVVHASPLRTSGVASRCHFLVEADGEGGWKVTAADPWLDQRAGGHIGGIWRDSSIGICLIGDFSRRGPPRGQFACLMDLVNALQEACRISADRVYLHSDLVARSTSPGAAFPAGEFSARLLVPPR